MISMDRQRAIGVFSERVARVGGKRSEVHFLLAREGCVMMDRCKSGLRLVLLGVLVYVAGSALWPAPKQAGDGATVITADAGTTSQVRH